MIPRLSDRRGEVQYKAGRGTNAVADACDPTTAARRPGPTSMRYCDACKTTVPSLYRRHKNPTRAEYHDMVGNHTPK